MKQTRWDVEKEIALEAMKNPEFRKKLLSNPKEVLRNHFENKKVGASVLDALDKLDIQICQEKKNEWKISLPEFFHEKSEAELQKVSANDDCGVWTTG